MSGLSLRLKDLTLKNFQGACPRTPLALRCLLGITGSQHDSALLKIPPHSIFFLGKALDVTLINANLSEVIAHRASNLRFWVAQVATKWVKIALTSYRNWFFMISILNFIILHFSVWTSPILAVWFENLSGIIHAWTHHCHLHPLQAANCCRNSQLVVDEDDVV